MKVDNWIQRKADSAILCTNKCMTGNWLLMCLELVCICAAKNLYSSSLGLLKSKIATREYLLIYEYVLRIPLITTNIASSCRSLQHYPPNGSPSRAHTRHEGESPHAHIHLASKRLEIGKKMMRLSGRHGQKA